MESTIAYIMTYEDEEDIFEEVTSVLQIKIIEDTNLDE